MCSNNECKGTYRGDKIGPGAGGMSKDLSTTIKKFQHSQATNHKQDKNRTSTIGRCKRGGRDKTSIKRPESGGEGAKVKRTDRIRARNDKTKIQFQYEARNSHEMSEKFSIPFDGFGIPVQLLDGIFITRRNGSAW